MTIRTAGTKKESETLFKPTLNPIFQYSIDYDSTKPEETIREFVKNISSMISRYEDDTRRIVEIEQELNDLNHYLEFLPAQTVAKGYKLYRKIADLRKERRACKNEIDLLQPVYEYFHATEVLNRLRKVQGDTGKLQKSIDERSYVCRTNVCDGLLDKPEGKSDELKALLQFEPKPEADNAVSL